MIATRRQINALGAHLIRHGAALEEAGERAHAMLAACGYDMTRLSEESVDGCAPFLYSANDTHKEDPG